MSIPVIKVVNQIGQIAVPNAPGRGKRFDESADRKGYQPVSVGS